MQADETPAGAPNPQHRAEFVPQPERREDVPVTVTPRWVTVGRLYQGAHASRVTGQVSPLIDVLVQELVRREVWAGIRWQFLPVGPVEQ